MYRFKIRKTLDGWIVYAYYFNNVPHNSGLFITHNIKRFVLNRHLVDMITGIRTWDEACKVAQNYVGRLGKHDKPASVIPIQRKRS